MLACLLLSLSTQSVYCLISFLLTELMFTIGIFFFIGIIFLAASTCSSVKITRYLPVTEVLLTGEDAYTM